MKKMKSKLISLIVAVLFAGIGGSVVLPEWLGGKEKTAESESTVTESTIIEQDDKDEALPEYTDEAYTAVNNNQPAFTEADWTMESFESYSELDSLGRCGETYACLGQDLMPTEERESISHIKPSGWKQGQYDFVDGKSLYNRCHLIGFQLAGENANEKNLITGTRYMNTEGMLPFENMVADYIKETGNHVLYRVTPIYEGENLVASGVQMEAYSVEDEGDGICFNVYVYNVQPGVEIDYATGENKAIVLEEAGDVQDFVLNVKSKKFHLPDCNGLSQTKEENKQEYEGTREMLIVQGYEPCKSCNP